MKKHIEKYLENTLKVLQLYVENQEAKAKNDNDKGKETKPYSFPAEYKGYISSLGAGIKMSGLLPTLAVYYSQENKSNEDRGQICQFIADILQKHKGHSYTFHNKNLFLYAIDKNLNQKALLQKDILDASIALKLCIRTFPSAKPKNSDV